MVYYSEKLNAYLDIDLIYEAIQNGNKVSDGFHGFFLNKKENCICYNTNGSTAVENTKEALTSVIQRLDEYFDLRNFKIGKDLYVNMI